MTKHWCGIYLPFRLHRRVSDRAQRRFYVRCAHRGRTPAATRAATPKARELFRRELQRIPVQFAVTCEEEGVKLAVTDHEGHKAVVYSEEIPQPAQKDQTAAIERALGKTGGTPFLCEKVELSGTPGFLPGSVWNELRREALETLLEKRSSVTPPCRTALSAAAFCRPQCGDGARTARTGRAFFHRGTMPGRLCGKAAVAGLSHCRGGKNPRRLARKNAAGTAAGHVRQTGSPNRRTAERFAEWWFAGAVANNAAHLLLAKDWPLYGGLGLNITNPMSAARYAELGLEGMLLHPETAVNAMQAVAPMRDGKPLPTAALCYGHIPLMLTRACPLRNVHSCAQCSGGGTLRDRKGRDFTVTCSAPGGAGIRTVFNPVPLYMGDRLAELPVDVAVAAFTTESPARAAQILAALAAGQSFDSEFTRGLYYTNN